MYLVNIKPCITLPWWEIFRLVLTCRLAFSQKRLIEECYQRIELLPEKIFQRDSQLLINLGFRDDSSSIIFYTWQLEQMSSEQSSFRDIFAFPQQGQGKYSTKGSRHRKPNDVTKPNKQTFYDIVKKVKHVAMFTQILKRKIAQKHTLNTHTLKQNQLEFLENDSQEEQRQVCFEHDSKLVFGLELVFIGVMLAQMWRSTYEVVFGEGPFGDLLTGVALTIYLIHAWLFNWTEYTNQKLEIISNRLEIQQIYVQQKLPKDVLYLLMLIIQLTPFDDFKDYPWLFVIIRLISLIGYSQLSETCEKVENLLSVSNQAEISIAIFKLLFKVALFLHFLSISLNLLAQVQAQHVSQTWLNSNDLEYSTSFEKYIIGWYWGATILSTVGFGDITPKNNYERFFISIIQVICCMTFGFFVNVIGSLIKMKAESEEKYEKEVRSLNRCLNFLNASSEIKHKIRTHYFNRHIIEKIHDPNEEKQLLQNMTPNLQKTLLEENNTNVLKKSTLMQKFTEGTLLRLAHIMKKVILAPEHILYSKNSVDHKLWFIENGKIQEFTDNFKQSTLRKTIFSYSQQEPVVGWINFLTQTAYKTMTKASKFTIAYELQQEGFLSAMRQDRGQYFKFMHMKHTMIGKNRKYMHKCISCDRYTHNVINCPRIHFIRSDIKKLAEQSKYYLNYITEQKKAKKFRRFSLRYSWKFHFANGELEKGMNMMMNNDSVRVSNGNIENLFKNALFRESVMGFERRKMSFMISRKQLKQEVAEQQNKENNRESYEKSVYSCGGGDQIIIEPMEELVYDRIFFASECPNYMPDHDIDKILTLYIHKIPRSFLPKGKGKKLPQQN